MVMKVQNVNSIGFLGVAQVTNPLEKKNTKNEIKELSAITPDFAVKTPQKYNKLGVTELKNGLKIHSYKLSNGYKVTIVPMDGSPATVKNYVNVGAFNETDNIKGISHFLEHMAFNGTNGKDGYLKLNQGDSFKKIDQLGGWTNASTGLAITDYVNSTPLLDDKDIEEQIRIIAAMTEDLALTNDMIEKEKGPVCSEINMIMDKPATIAYDQAIRTLFNVKSSSDELIAGSTKHIQNLTKEDVKAYYDKYYTPDNMNLVITGDIDPDKAIELVARNFHSNKKSKGVVYHEKLTPINKTVRKDFITNKAKSTLSIVSFVGPQNNDIKSKIIGEILQEYVGSVDSGFRKDLKPYNTMTGLDIEKISNNPYSPVMLSFGFDTSDENSEKALKTVCNKLYSLKSPNEKELEIIKKRLLKSFNNSLDYSENINTVIGNLTFQNDLSYLYNYEGIINDITSDDINNYIEKYINLDKASITVVHPETTIENIKANHEQVNGITFKGYNRVPLKKELVSESTLDNNYKMGFVETKNNNIRFRMELSYTVPENINPAAIFILDDILTRGTANKTEEEFDKLKEENIIGVGASISSDSMTISCSSTSDNLEKTIKCAKELLTQPRITEEEFKYAREMLEDYLSRMTNNSGLLYENYLGNECKQVLSQEKLKKGLETVTIDDVKNLHSYILENSVGTIAMNIPSKDKEIKDVAIKEFSNFNKVKPYEIITEDTYKVNDKPIVLTASENVSQADIKQIYKFKRYNELKDRLTLLLLNSILSSSSSIGLFNTLREKEQLAYSVYSDYDCYGNTTELSLNILTTTDNKETDEVSFENLQKSINGFHRQINSLRNSEFSDEDLESAKKMFKATLLNKEGVPAKVSSISSGLNSKFGIYSDNKAMEFIDTITREDIVNMANEIFMHPPIYSIVASENTLKANAEFLESLK